MKHYIATLTRTVTQVTTVVLDYDPSDSLDLDEEELAGLDWDTDFDSEALVVDVEVVEEPTRE